MYKLKILRLIVNNIVDLKRLYILDGHTHKRYYEVASSLSVHKWPSAILHMLKQSMINDINNTHIP